MLCPRCASNQNDDIKFCTSCGANLQAVRESFSKLASFNVDSLTAALKQVAAERNVKIGALVHPARLAVTGSNAGPSLYHLLEVLGREEVLARIDRALDYASTRS